MGGAKASPAEGVLLLLLVRQRRREVGVVAGARDLGHRRAALAGRRRLLRPVLGAVPGRVGGAGASGRGIFVRLTAIVMVWTRWRCGAWFCEAGLGAIRYDRHIQCNR